MVKSTVHLDEATALELRELAKVTGRRQGDLIREALRRYLQVATWPKPKGIGQYRSGHSGISKNAEDVLQGLTAERR